MNTPIDPNTAEFDAEFDELSAAYETVKRAHKLEADLQRFVGMTIHGHKIVQVLHGATSINVECHDENCTNVVTIGLYTGSFPADADPLDTTVETTWTWTTLADHGPTYCAPCGARRYVPGYPQN
jgi:hypothetical protein